MTKLFRGGGTIANTISDVPERIDKMLGNYKKVATGTANVRGSSGDGKFRFPLNLKFKPSRVMLVVTNFYYGNGTISNVHTTYPNGWLDSDLKNREVTMMAVLSGGSGIDGPLKLESFDSKQLIVSLGHFRNNESNRLTINWIAIE